MGGYLPLPTTLQHVLAGQDAGWKPEQVQALWGEIFCLCQESNPDYSLAQPRCLVPKL